MTTELHPELLDWPGVGDFDVAVEEPSGSSLSCVFEVKRCKRASKLNEALWDAAKLALASACGRASSTYLFYAAPAAAFDATGVGGLLFRGGTWEIADLIDQYSSWWDWPVKTRPSRLPAQVAAKPVGVIGWETHAAGAWQARCLSIEGSAARWVQLVDGWPERE